MNHSEIIWHAPSVDPNNTNNADKVGKLEADQNNVYVRLGKTYLQETSTKFNFNIAHPADIRANGDILIHTPANNKINLKTDDANSMNLQIDKTQISMTSPENTNGFKWEINANDIIHRIGDTYWKYDTLSSSATYRNLILAGSCNRLYITPNGHFENKLGVKNTLYVGDTLPNASDITGTTFFNKTTLEIRNDSTGQITKINDAGINVTNTNGGTANRTISVGNQNGTQKIVTGFGTMTIQNNSANANITFTDGTTSRDCHIYKPSGKNYLVIDKGLKVDGDITTLNNGRVFNAVYNGFGEFFESNEPETIELGDPVYVGQDGFVHKVSSRKDIKRIIGICSDTSGIILGGDKIPDKRKIQVEMLGQVWIKTDELNLIPGDKVRINSKGKATKYKLFGKSYVVLTNVKNNKVRILFVS